MYEDTKLPNGEFLNFSITICRTERDTDHTESFPALFIHKLLWISHHCGDVDSPDDVTFWTSGHFPLEYVGLCVDGRDFGVVFLEADFLHRPVLPAQTSMAAGRGWRVEKFGKNWSLGPSQYIIGYILPFCCFYGVSLTSLQPCSLICCVYRAALKCLNDLIIATWLWLPRHLCPRLLTLSKQHVSSDIAHLCQHSCAVSVSFCNFCLARISF